MQKQNKTLWYRTPAQVWTEALPVGNGRLGAMIFGGVQHERLALNEATLWSGGPREWNNPNAKAILPQVRQALFAGDYLRADELCREMQGPFNQSYQPLGNLHIDFTNSEGYQNYSRALDLDRAVATVRYEQEDAIFERKVIASFPAQVIAIRLTCSQPGRISFQVRLDSLLHHTTLASNLDTLVLTGKCPAQVDPSYLKSLNPILYADQPDGEEMTFAIQIRVIADGGTTTANDASLQINGADAVTLLISAATSFNGFDKSPVREGRNPAILAAAYLDAIESIYDTLEQRHIEDHQRLFSRVTFNVNAPISALELPTDERLKTFNGSHDSQLPILLFHYGRYLLIASSRPGGQAANLQGLWNDLMRPPWSSNWTLNINAQMNYWPVESCNLAECHEPLFQLIADLAINGQKTAEVNYGARGWVAHHNTDIWRQTAPVGNYGHGDPVWANWPMGGAWLCQHLWEHFAFSGDVNFLRDTAYPLMKGASEFCLDWLVDDGQGHLVTAPSFSPELHFLTSDGKAASASIAATMDTAIIWDLFTNCAQAADVLETDKAFADQLRAAKGKLVPFQIGSRGQLQEWLHDFEEEEVHHRHTSHLFAVHPGHQITPDVTPELSVAAHRSMTLRTDKSTGWSQAWKINLYARLRDSARTYQLVCDFFTLIENTQTGYGAGGGLYANLFDAHPPFQIDGNFGYTAGVVELLLQSHADEIHLLPTLPKEWATGSITGLRARGGFELDISWQDGRLTTARIHSTRGAVCRVRCSAPITVYSDDQIINPTDHEQETVTFQTEIGKTYVLRALALQGSQE